MKPDREQDKLLGPVHTVRTRVEKMLAEVPRPSTSARMLPSLSIYDVTGQTVEKVVYRDNGDVSSRALFSYDVEGKRTQIAYFDDARRLTRRSTYTYNSSEGAVEDFTLNPEDQVIERIVRKYDDQGGERETSFYMPDGLLTSRMVTIRDEQGREKETLFCRSDPEIVMTRAERAAMGGVFADEEDRIKLGKLKECGEDAYFSGKLVYAYDEAGRLQSYTIYAPNSVPMDRFEFKEDKGKQVSEVRHYNAAGEMRSREVTEREVDAAGNWVKAMISTWVRGVSQTESPEPTEVHHREITYYEPI